MPEEKNLFEIGNEILAGQAEILAGQSEILNEITGLKDHDAKRDEQIALMEEKLNKLEANQTNQPKINSSVHQKNNQEIIQTFLKQSKKSWMWVGNNADFRKHKAVAIVSLLISLLSSNNVPSKSTAISLYIFHLLFNISNYKIKL